VVRSSGPNSDQCFVGTPAEPAAGQHGYVNWLKIISV
jgi:hypothetical protein